TARPIPRFPPVTSTDRATKAGRPAGEAAAVSATAVSVMPANLTCHLREPEIAEAVTGAENSENGPRGIPFRREDYVGRRRLISRAANAASANTSAPSRSQPVLASPRMVS